LAAPNDKKKYCATYIPKTWPQFTGPAYRDGMSVAEAQRLWSAFLRVHSVVRPTPALYSKGEG
jgi:hypothetical protein